MTKEKDDQLKKIGRMVTLVVMILSLGYSIAMTVNISPIKLTVQKKIEADERQDVKIHEMDKRIDQNAILYQVIREDLKEIKELLKKN